MTTRGKLGALLLGFAVSLTFLGAAPADAAYGTAEGPAVSAAEDTGTPEAAEAPDLAAESAIPEVPEEAEAVYGAVVPAEEAPAFAESEAAAPEENGVPEEAAYGGLGASTGFAVLIGAGAFTAFRIRKNQTKEEPKPVFYENLSQQQREQKDSATP